MINTVMQPKVSTGPEIRNLAVIGLLFVFSVSLGLKLRNMESAWVEPPPERREKWDPKLFRVLSFGHLPAVVDWFWLQVLMDPALNHIEKGTHPVLYYNLDLITDLDPVYYESYIYGANLLSVIRDDGPGARDLLLKGTEFRSNGLNAYPAEARNRFWRFDWNLFVTLAYVYLFELNDMPKASATFLEASAIPGAPDYLLRLAKRLEVPGGQYEVGLKLLHFLLSSTNQDPLYREELQKKQSNLFIGQFLFTMNQSFQAYLKKQPRYQTSSSLSPAQMQEFWLRYQREEKASLRDPWGGTLGLDQNGRVVTSTPHIRVFGLD